LVGVWWGRRGGEEIGAADDGWHWCDVDDEEAGGFGAKIEVVADGGVEVEELVGWDDDTG
jgi:hypothetical protein